MYSHSFFILPCFLFTVCFLLRSIRHGQDFVPELVCQVYVRAHASKLPEGELGSKKTTTNCGMNVNVLVCQVYTRASKLHEGELGSKKTTTNCGMSVNVLVCQVYTHVQVNSMKVNLVVKKQLQTVA